MQGANSPLDVYFQYVYGFFNVLSNALQPLGIPFGPGDWFFLVYTLLFIAIIAFLVRRGSRGTSIPVGVQRIIASTGDVSAGLAGTKKIKFIRTPADALVFLKIEENAIQQALAAVDYFAQKGEIDEVMKDKLLATYRGRLEAVRAAIAKDEDLKEIVDTSTAVDRARSDYLRKLAAMSGKAVAVESEAAGPPSVGMPSTTETAPSPATPAASPPSGGPPGGGPPGGGPPGGGPPGGGPPGGGPPGGGPPGGGLRVVVLQAVVLRVVVLQAVVLQAVVLQAVVLQAVPRLRHRRLLLHLHQGPQHPLEQPALPVVHQRARFNLRCLLKWNASRH
ncbi:MAG: hypothetical protein ACTSPE_01690 [Candidatus Thorarchaeota archaeon]